MSTPLSHRLAACLLFIECAVSGSSFAGDQPALRQRIDQLIEAKSEAPVAGQASDPEFLRRVYLDLVGRVPTAEETRQFAADPFTDKRLAVIDRLLASDEHPKRMAELFDVMLMERLGDHEPWREYLRVSFATNKPWDQMTREMLDPNADDEATRAAGYFLAKRLENYGQNPVDHPALIRDVGRLFLGVDLQCAQCHDHLFVDAYHQEDYQGLAAFLGHTVLRRDVEFPAVAENLVTQPVAFKSVFVGDEHMTGPRLPGGEESEVPTFAKGEEYEFPPDRKTRFPGVPKFRPLRLLAEQTPQNSLFARNIANRIWWMMMGRGLVHPLDLHHEDNPASHPELLDALSSEFVGHDHDLRYLLREIAMSQAYQRSSLLPDGVTDAVDADYRVALEKPLSAEQLYRAVVWATGGPKTQPDNLESADAPTESAEGESAADPEAEFYQRFVKAFASPPREPEVEHNPTVKAALFLMNDGEVLKRLSPSEPRGLVPRLIQLEDNRQLVNELYWNILSRPANDAEVEQSARYLADHADRGVAVSRLAWALLASNEFCVNH